MPQDANRSASCCLEGEGEGGRSSVNRRMRVGGSGSGSSSRIHTSAAPVAEAAGVAAAGAVAVRRVNPQLELLAVCVVGQVLDALRELILAHLQVASSVARRKHPVV